MAAIDSLYRSSKFFDQTIPTTNTFNTSFNYSTAENLYGSDVLLYTGLIPNSNPLSGSGDGAKYASGGIDIVEKIDKQILTTVEDSFFAFTHSRLTYLLPGSVFGITLWAKDASGSYTVEIPESFYDIFYYEKSQTYVIYFSKKYEPIYSNGVLDNPSYPPAITCYRYCGPKGIENLSVGGGATGPTGPQGETGPQGTTGPTGAGGAGTPDLYMYLDEYTNETTTYSTICSVTGLEPNTYYMISIGGYFDPQYEDPNSGWQNWNFRIVNGADEVGYFGYPSVWTGYSTTSRSSKLPDTTTNVNTLIPIPYGMLTSGGYGLTWNADSGGHIVGVHFTIYTGSFANNTTIKWQGKRNNVNQVGQPLVVGGPLTGYDLMLVAKPVNI